MAAPFDIVSFLEADSPSAEEQSQALQRALRRDRTFGTLAAVTGNKNLSGFAQPLLSGAQQQEETLGQAAGARFRNAMEGRRLAQQEALADRRLATQESLTDKRLAAQAEAQRRQMEQQIAMQERLFAQQQAQAERQAAAALALEREKAGLSGGPPMKPLTESQGQAAMFLEQSQRQLGQAQERGKDILPAPGVLGLGEAAAWKAREWGVPQLSTDATLARQSILLSIAEPIVRAESGAAVPADEVRRLAIRYVPMPGESREEQHRKLQSLVGAVGAVMQKLPPQKAAEFAPFQQQVAQWAAELGDAPAGVPGPSPSPGAPVPSASAAARQRAASYYGAK